MGSTKEEVQFFLENTHSDQEGDETRERSQDLKEYELPEEDFHYSITSFLPLTSLQINFLIQCQSQCPVYPTWYTRDIQRFQNSYGDI